MRRNIQNHGKTKIKAGGHIPWLGEVKAFLPSFVNLSCTQFTGRPCFSLSDIFFVQLACLSCHQPPGICLSYLLFLFLRPCLIHARMSGRSRAIVHGHTFFHSWSEPMTLVVGLLRGTTFLSNLTLGLFVSFI